MSVLKKNVHINNIIRSKQIVTKYLVTHTYTDIKAINEKEIMNWKENGWVCMGKEGKG